MHAVKHTHTEQELKWVARRNGRERIINCCFKILCPHVTVLVCLWAPASAYDCMLGPKHECAWACGTPSPPARLNTQALFPRELCGPEWVISQPQPLCSARMLRLPTAQGRRGGRLMGSQVYGSRHTPETRWSVCATTESLHGYPGRVHLQTGLCVHGVICVPVHVCPCVSTGL